MEGNLPIRVISHGSMDLQGSMHLHQPQNLQNSNHHQQQQQQLNHSQNPTVYDVFPLSSSADYYKVDNFKVSMSDEDDPSFNTEDRTDGQAETLKGKKGSPWQRVKWTDVMVRLLITALSYIGEDDSTTECDNGRRRKFTVSQKIGKWKAISKVMAERGYYVSPQQCEDKFNDLNKRYKRLNDILGRGTSCQVVENPALLDIMHHVSDKSKDDVRKILSSKQLFYEEMCSYHNGNRLHLPADASLHRSLLLALSNRDHHDRKRILREEAHEDDQCTDSEDGDDDTEENNTLYGGSGVPSCLPKRMKQGVDHDHDLNRRRRIPSYVSGPWRYRDGLTSRPTANSDEIQLRIDPMDAGLDEEITGLHRKIRKLKGVAQEIETEAKLQNNFINQLQMALIKTQAGVKNNMRRMNKGIIQQGSNHVLHVILFALFCFFVVYLWSKFSRR